jgi:hypothetical protein
MSNHKAGYTMFDLLNQDLMHFEEQRRRRDMIRIIRAAHAAGRGHSETPDVPPPPILVQAAAMNAGDCEESAAA